MHLQTDENETDACGDEDCVPVRRVIMKTI